MSRLVLFGIGPYPTEKGAAISGPTIRLRQFAEPLARAGHAVHLVMLEKRVREVLMIGGIEGAVALTPSEILEPWKVLKALRSPAIEAVFGVGSMMPLAAAARLARQIGKPLWADYFGDPLAEFHAGISRAGVKADLVLRDHIWKFVREGLRAGDRFSTVSERQRNGLIGQLILTGRGIEGTEPHARVHTIPCAVPSDWVQGTVDLPPFPAQLARELSTERTRYLYVGGSWTPWMDEQRMGQVLGMLLAREPRFELVVRGGPADGLPGHIRKSFFDAFSGHSLLSRVHELPPGSGPPESDLLAHAEAAVLLDREIPESHLGSRNRLLSFLRWGVRLAVSPRSEIARDLVEHELATALPEDDMEAAATLAALVRSGNDNRIERIERGRRYLENLTFEETVTPAVQWARSPDQWPSTLGEGLVGKWNRFEL